MHAPSRHPSLGEFLRARRERLQPEDVDLPAGPRRRATGLRREEVAALAGISSTWYTWIEQGRAAAVSDQALAGLATALRLTPAERGYLFHLAGRADPTPSDDAGAAAQPPLQALVDALRTPAYVLDAQWDAVAWNEAAADHFEGWLGGFEAGADTGDARPNLLRHVFVDPGARRFIDPWQERAERLVAEFRADTGGRSEEPARSALVEELAAASPAFRSAWSSQRVLSREGGLRRFVHPRRGACSFEQTTWRLATQPQLKLTVLLPV